MHARSLVHQSACMQVVLFRCAVRGQVFCDAVLIMLGVLSLCRWRTCMWQVATTFRHQSKRYRCTTARNDLCKGNMMFCDMLLVALLFCIYARLLGFSVCVIQASCNRNFFFRCSTASFLRALGHAILSPMGHAVLSPK